MIDIKLIRESPELVKENIKKKFQNNKLPLIDEIKKKDEEWRKLKIESDTLRASRNKISIQISEFKKAKKDASKLLKEAKKIPDEISKIDGKMFKLEDEINILLKQIPNIINESVHIGKDDSQNVELEKIGKPIKFDFKPKNHIEIGEALGLFDFDAASKTSGEGFYYINNELALLNQALIRFGIEKVVAKGYKYIETPLMLRGDVIRNVTDLNDMKNQVYKIDGEDLYLIGTSEHSLIGRFIDKLFNVNELPIKNTSYSMCFRKEIGAHGIEEKGIYRRHQFNKVEMINICHPKESMKYFEEAKNIAVDIFKSLGIPIRILEFCSGALGDLKHYQIDIEAWSPVKQEYYEVVSCSNLTDAQARKLKMRVIEKNGEKFVPHTINCTAIATSRAMVAILENFQQKDGSVEIPKALWKYTGFKEIKKK